MTLGILTQNMGGHFYDSIAQGAIEGLADSGYTPLFVDGGWEHTREVASIEALLSRKVDGLLVVGGRIDAITLVKIQQSGAAYCCSARYSWSRKAVYLRRQQADWLFVDKISS